MHWHVKEDILIKFNKMIIISYPISDTLVHLSKFQNKKNTIIFVNHPPISANMKPHLQWSKHLSSLANAVYAQLEPVIAQKSSINLIKKSYLW